MEERLNLLLFGCLSRSASVTVPKRIPQEKARAPEVDPEVACVRHCGIGETQWQQVQEGGERLTAIVPGLAVSSSSASADGRSSALVWLQGQSGSPVVVMGPLSL